MGYEIELSYNVQKKSYYTLNTITKTIELADEKQCAKHFQFTEYSAINNKAKNKTSTPIIVFCFENDRFTEMTCFLQEILAKYNTNTHIESVYDTDSRNIIYASARYMGLMESTQKDDYKHRRQSRSYSETDYFILRDILKKNI